LVKSYANYTTTIFYNLFPPAGGKISNLSAALSEC